MDWVKLGSKRHIITETRGIAVMLCVTGYSFLIW